MYKEINFKELNLNPMTLFGEDWMALTSGNKEQGFNSMCIAWGHMGTLWERDSHSNRLPTVTCFVRPGRYTKGIMDKEELFTLSRFPEKYRKNLAYLGTHSGRDGDKIKDSGLTAIHEDGTMYFDEADLVLVCRKLYQAPLIEDGFIDRGLIDFNYPEKDYHEMYIGEIIKVLIKE